jgi:hypothetical protein
MGKYDHLGQIVRTANPAFEVTAEVITVESVEEVKRRGGTVDQARVIVGLVGLDGKPRCFAYQYGKSIIPSLMDEKGLITEDNVFMKAGEKRDIALDHFKERVESFSNVGKRMPMIIRLEPGAVESWALGEIGIDPRFNHVKEYILTERARVSDVLHKDGVLWGNEIKSPAVLKNFLNEIGTAKTGDAIVLSWVGFYEEVAGKYWNSNPKYTKEDIQRMKREGQGEMLTPNMAATQILKLAVGGSDIKESLLLDCPGVQIIYLPK